MDTRPPVDLRVSAPETAPVELVIPEQAPVTAPVERAPFLTVAGVNLAAFVLAAIFVLAVALTLLIYRTESGHSPTEVVAIERLLEQATRQHLAASSPEALQHATELVGKLSDARKSARDFWMGLVQLLLLNIFLPVLTSILGYVFGTSKASDS